jgi:HEAT repeat protein
MSDQAFEALNTYDWGVEPKVLAPIDEAVIKTRGDAAARSDLESRLIAELKSGAPRAAKDYACRQLRTIGTTASVPALAALLPDPNLSHMARYALERIPDPTAGAALRGHLPNVSGNLKIGIISSLGARGEDTATGPAKGPFGFLHGASHGGTVPLLSTLLTDSDPAVAKAATRALGMIGTPAASQALAAAKPTPGTQAAIADATLACAEQLLAAGKKREAKADYERLLKNHPSKLIQSAAERGMQACV